MSKTKTATKLLFLTATILAGAFASAAAAYWLVDGGAGISYLALFLGAFFGGLGWSLAENLGETIVFLLITSVLGGVALIFLSSEMLRIIDLVTGNK